MTLKELDDPLPTYSLAPVQPLMIPGTEQCVGSFIRGKESIYFRQWATFPCSQSVNNIAVICEDRSLNTQSMYKQYAKTSNISFVYRTSDDGWVVPKQYCPDSYIHVIGSCIRIIYAVNNINHNSCALITDEFLDSPKPSLTYMIEYHKFTSVYDRYNNEVPWAICSEQFNSLTQITGLYKCNDSTFIVDHFFCDGDLDCPDGSDEAVCEHVCRFTSMLNSSCFGECQKGICECDSLYFHCIKSARCLPLSQFCDGIKDCAYNEDEILCTQKKIAATLKVSVVEEEYQCQSGGKINLNRVNDTIPDCPYHGDDEFIPHLDKTLITVKDNSIARAPCIPGHPKQFPLSAICQLYWTRHGEVTTCRNGAHLTNCIHHSCPHQFKCPYSYCIPVQAVCDGIMDCPHGSDEAMCNTNKHCPGLFRCKGPSHRCIHVTNINNGNVDCPFYKDDEVRPGIVHCPDHCTCSHHAMRCTKLTIPSMNTTNITSLVLRTDSVYSLEEYFSKFVQIRYLDLSHSTNVLIGNNTFVSLTSLVVFKLRNISIETVRPRQFVGLQNVLDFDLGGNSINTLQPHAFFGLSALTSLDLSQMNIQLIYACAFEGLHRLNVLNLSLNAITLVNEHTFCGLLKMEVLDLRGNAIINIDPLTFLSSLSLGTVYSDVSGLCCYAVLLQHCTPKFVDDFSTCTNILHHVIIRYGAWLTAFVSLTENIFALFFFNTKTLKTSKKKQIHNMNRNSLMLSDVLMGIYFMALCLYDSRYAGNYVIIGTEWRHGWHCRVLSCISMLSFEMSLLMTLVMALERFFAVCFPLKNLVSNVLAMRVSIACVWLVGCVLSVLPNLNLYILAQGLNNALCVALISFNSFSVWLIALMCSINTVVILMNALLYSSVIRVILNRKNNPVANQQRNSKEFSITVRIVCIIVANSSSWMILLFIGALQISGVLVNTKVFAICALFLLPINTVINPIFNFFTTTEFAQIIKRFKGQLNNRP